VSFCRPLFGLVVLISLLLPEGEALAYGLGQPLEIAAISSDYQIVEELHATPENIGRAFELTQAMASKLAPLFDLPIKVAVLERKEVSPMLSTVSSKGDCIVVINRGKHAWSYWEPFLVHGVLTVDELYEFAALHEIAHCFNKLGPDANYMQYLEAGRPSESFSDIFALSMMSDVREDFEMKRIVDAVLEIRASYNSIIYSSHNTTKNIRKVYDQLVYKTPAHKNVFLLANYAIRLSELIE
jgi:hypothetical protein